MIRSSLGLILRFGQRRNIAVRAGRQGVYLRCLSSNIPEKPKVPTSSSSELMPVGAGENLPATLIDFQAASKIEGEESHVAKVQLRPGETLRAEAGSMIYMTQGVIMDTNLSGASSAFSRMMTGRVLIVKARSLVSILRNDSGPKSECLFSF